MNFTLYPKITIIRALEKLSNLRGIIVPIQNMKQVLIRALDRLGWVRYESAATRYVKLTGLEQIAIRDYIQKLEAEIQSLKEGTNE